MLTTSTAIGLLGRALLVAAAIGMSAQASAQSGVYVPARTPDGQPDFQGMWGGGTLTIEPGYDGNLGTGYYQEFFPTGANIAPGSGRAGAVGAGAARAGGPPPLPRIRTDDPKGRIPFQPWARDRKEANFKTIYKPGGPESLDYVDPVARCLPTGVPRSSYISIGGYQILQTPGYITFLGEWNHQYRVVPLDGRPHVGPKVRTWMGDPRGRWEGNTLVVETTNSNGRTWLDHMGSIHTADLKVIERYTMTDPKTIAYEITLEDPKAFTRPWKLIGALDRTTEEGFELIEYACHEGNARSMESYTGNNR
jgi:hypothetical protein